MTQEEQVVRMLYGKFVYLTQLNVVSMAALDSYISKTAVDEKLVARKLENATPEIALSDFEVGNLGEVLSRKWSDFYTLPTQETLTIQIGTQQFTDNKLPMVSWQVASARWEPYQPLPEEALAVMRNMTVCEILDVMAKSQPTAGVAYTR